MRLRCLRTALFAGALAAKGLGAAAQSALVHLQGEPGSREAYFANFAVVLDRTPADRLLGPTAVRQLETVVVYESAGKPEFSALRLQFECVVKHAYDGKKVPPQPAFDAPVRLRVGEGSWLLRREDLKTAPVPAGEWRSAASPVLLKLHKIACHEDVMRSALVKAAKQNQDLGVFAREIEKIGLPGDLQLVSQQLASEYLDFAWWVLWRGAPRPDPSGKWSTRPTAQELREAQAQMDAARQQLATLAGQVRPQLEAGVQRLQETFNFEQAAAAVRGERKLSRSERQMLTAWQGKTETEVAATMGAPLVANAGDLRFLSYGKEFDNRVTVGNRQGAVWQEGFYEHCNLQFVMLADATRWRVVDVRIWTHTTERLGTVTYACTGLLEAPR
jgi:hypothetical protein